MPDTRCDRFFDRLAVKRVTRRSRSSLLQVVPLLFLLGGSLVQVGYGSFDHDISGHALGADDAFISFRYASNFVSGHGLVFNPGERVEGYSNLLYVLLVSVGLRVLPHESAYEFSVGLNLVLITFCYFAFGWLARFRLRGHLPLVALFLFSLTPTLWIWTGSGMETPLVLLLLLLTWMVLEVGLESEGRWVVASLAALAALAVLARADGFLIPLVAAGFCLLRDRRRLALAIGLATVSTLGFLVVWRLSYYGYPLPNTYYVKVAGHLGDRLLDGLWALWDVATREGLAVHVGVLLAYAASQFAKRGRGAVAHLPFELCFAIAWLCYYLYVGGDVLFDRFLVPIFPMGVFLALRWAQDWSGKPLATTRLVILIASLGAAQSAAFLSDSRMIYRAPKYDRWVTLGRFLRDAHAGSLLAIDAAGKVPFYSGLRTIDMLGLNDEHIAHGSARSNFQIGHNKFDPGYVVGREPDLIAAWMKSNLDLHWGLDRRRYARAGYRIRYLVATHATPPGDAILDVAELEPVQIRRLRRRGYAYAVLERRR